MSAISNYLEEAWLSTLRGDANKGTFTSPTAIYVKLHIGDPGEAGTSNASSVLTRVAVTFGAPSQDASSPTKGTMSSNIDVSWTNWGGTSPETVSHISIWDASSGGNCLWYGALTASKAVSTGDTLTIPSGSLTLTLA